MDKACGYCGGSMNLPREGAKFCTSKCRVYAHRAAKRNALPVELTSRDRWVRHTASKIPRTVRDTSASSTNPFTWSSHTEVMQSSVGVGAGYVLGQGVGCIDLDHCIDGDTVAPWAVEVLRANPNTYVELSMSGTGLHVFGLLAEAPGRKIRDGRNIEVYSSRRFIAVTGNRYGKSPARLAPLALP